MQRKVYTTSRGFGAGECSIRARLLLLFFFQAEDGIRDHCVTGVQTCALPISFGYQASNRTITLPIEISVPGDTGTPAGFSTLTAAREVLLKEINQQTWTLRWTREDRKSVV